MPIKTRHLFTPEEVPDLKFDPGEKGKYPIDVSIVDEPWEAEADLQDELEEIWKSELLDKSVLCPYCRAEVFPEDFTTVLECAVCGYTGPEATFNAR
jgi:uncharacterized CHY-type Zn-finger protein